MHSLAGRVTLGSMQRSRTAPVVDPGPTVFIVDDDESVRESLGLLVQSAGWTVCTFRSAEEFLSTNRGRTPSCLVLDVSLPELSGLELQDRMAGEQLGMPIIFITGYGDVPMSVRAMKAGAVEFLTKPFDDDVLLEAIDQAIDRSRTAIAASTRLHDLSRRYELLSKREREVMDLVVTGLLNKQVAGELGISEITVKVPGVYFIVAAVQVGKENGDSDEYLDVWLKQNGKDVDNSGCRQAIKDQKFTPVLVSQPRRVQGR